MYLVKIDSNVDSNIDEVCMYWYSSKLTPTLTRYVRIYVMRVQFKIPCTGKVNVKWIKHLLCTYMYVQDSTLHYVCLEGVLIEVSEPCLNYAS